MAAKTGPSYTKGDLGANTRQLKAIFDPNVNFQVPLFQRPYVWTEDENSSPLWEDILALLDRLLRTGPTRAHFLGAIVLEQLPNRAESVEARQVIGAHRRLTTPKLFLMASRNLGAEHGAKRCVGRFTGLVVNGDDQVEEANEKFKLWPTNGERAAFKAIHSSPDLRSLVKAMKGRPELARSNLVGAYRYFHVRLSGWLNEKLDDVDDAPELDSKTVTDRLETLWQVVNRSLQLVVINLGREDEAQVIFETLNARGTELSPVVVPRC